MIAIYPILYVVVETCLVVCIKVTAVGENIGYNPMLINLIAEVIKLSFAIWIAYDEQELDSLRSVSGLMALKFGVSNLLYAVNNNLFHLFMSWLNPAVFVVAVNCFRTILTSALQQYVSGPLTARKYAACLCLLISFLATSQPDIMKMSSQSTSIDYSDKVWLMVVCAGIYSSISTCTSLWQERMLKDSPSLMVANIINYSVGASFQLLGVVYSSIQGVPVTLGLDVPMVCAIPFLMALSGISISFILRYFDNIVKLICSSICVLLIHVCVKTIQGDADGMFDVSFLCGWIFTLPAAYLYSAVPGKTPFCFQCCDRSAELSDGPADKQILAHSQEGPHRDAKPNAAKRLVFVLMGIAAYLSFSYFIDARTTLTELRLNTSKMRRRRLTIQAVEPADAQPPESYPLMRLNTSTSRSCELQSSGDVYALSTSFKAGPATLHEKFASVDLTTGSISLYCPGKLFMLPPQQPSEMEKWRKVDPQLYRFTALEPDGSPRVNRVVPWSALARRNESYMWLKCDRYRSVKLVIEPSGIGKNQKWLPRSPLDIQKNLEEYSQFSSEGSTSVWNRRSPVFDSVMVIYMDAVSKAKFESVFEKSKNLLKSMMGADGASSHQVFSLDKLHALGISSPSNYLPMYSGISPTSNHQQFSGATSFQVSNQNRRHLWLSDVAENMGYRTLFAYGGCQHYTLSNNSINLSKLWNNMENGGIQRQYMMETNNREPAQIMWPSSAQCEFLNRKLLEPRNHSARYWLGHDLALSQYFEWLQMHHQSHSAAKPLLRKSIAQMFSTLIIEDLHDGFVTHRWDEILLHTLHQLFYANASYMANTAVIFMADHGMHFGIESYSAGGFLRNKLPFGYMILPRSYLGKHPEERSNIEHNAKQLLTSLDLRVTILRWLTGRDWSSSESAWRNIRSDDQANRFYAHTFGKDLLLSKLSPYRDCSSAGIPLTFCGCSSMSCDDALFPILSLSLESIAAYVNHECQVLHKNIKFNLCVPLLAKDLEVSKQLDCVKFEQTVNFLVVIKNRDDQSKNRKPYLLSASLLLEDIHKSNVVLQSIKVASKYAYTWQNCIWQYKKLGVDIAALVPEDKRQYLYCSMRTGKGKTQKVSKPLS